MHHRHAEHNMLHLQAMKTWTKEPANSEAYQDTYAAAVLLQGMMVNLVHVFYEQHRVVVGAVEGKRRGDSHSIQKSRTAMSSGRITSNGVTTINSATQCAVAHMRRGKVKYLPHL